MGVPEVDEAEVTGSEGMDELDGEGMDMSDAIRVGLLDANELSVQVCSYNCPKSHTLSI